MVSWQHESEIPGDSAGNSKTIAGTDRAFGKQEFADRVQCRKTGYRSGRARKSAGNRVGPTRLKPRGARVNAAVDDEVGVGQIGSQFGQSLFKARPARRYPFNSNLFAA